jgi:hypothetical protein
MLRSYRFSSWFEDGLHSESKYLDELERAYRSDHGSSESILFSIYSRCSIVLAFNPLSATMQEMRFQKHWWTGNGPIAFPLRDKWSAHAWSRYFRMSMTVYDDQFWEDEDGDSYESPQDEEEWHSLPQFRIHARILHTNGQSESRAGQRCNPQVVLLNGDTSTFISHVLFRSYSNITSLL